jgi:hypothetical protein
MASAPSQALVDVRARIAAQIAQSAGSFSLPSVSKISTNNKRFGMPDGSTNAGPLRVVILDWRNVRAYFTGVYNAQNPSPPKCAAMAFKLEDLKPLPFSTTPQHETCEGCPRDEWGSDPSGGKGKACKNGVRLAVVPADLGGTVDPAKVPILALDITPTGLKSWNSLVAETAAKNLSPLQLITEVTFNSEVSYPTLLFDATGLHGNDERAIALLDEAQKLFNQHPFER